MELATSMNLLFHNNLDIEKAMDYLYDVGFRNLDFNFCDWLFESSPFLDSNWNKWLKNIKRRADSLGVKFVQAHGPIFNKFDDSINRKMMDLSIRSIEGSAILGVKWIVFEPETSPGAFDNKHLKLLKDKNIEWIEELLKKCEEVDVGIAIENVVDLISLSSRKCSRWYGSIPAELIDLVDSINHPLLGICWDTGHANINNLNQYESIISLGARLKATHIQDNNGLSDQHLLPFYGTINWKDVISALLEIRYEGYFTYEIHNFIRPLPEKIKPYGLRYIVDVGNSLINGYF